MKEKPLMAFLMERGVRENYSFFFAHKEDQSEKGSVRKSGCKASEKNGLSYTDIGRHIYNP